MTELIYEELTYKIIGAARDVYKELGSGFLESFYEDSLCYELDILGISYFRQIELDAHYKDKVFEKRFRADLLIEKKVIVENKAIKEISKQDEAQLINYLKVSKVKVGFLFNFGSDKFQMLRRVY